jgi:hypothetical protein
MRVCGVELKGNDAIICLLSLDEGLFSLPECRVAKLDLNNANDAEHLQRFQFAFAKLMVDYKVDKVVIRQRPTKGKFAGGYVGFKLEAAMQLSKELDVTLLSNAELKESLKRTELTIDFRGTGLKKFQEPAFTTAFAFLSL